MGHSQSWIIIVLIMAFAMYRRIRRTVTFQPFSKRRFTIRMVLFGVIGVLWLAFSAVHPIHLLYALLGIIVGGVLAYFAMRTTQFEVRQGKWFYRPNVWIGTVLVVLFLGRIVYRFFIISDEVHQQIAAGATAAQNQNFAYMNSPLTTAVFFVLVAYYLIYYVFLIRKEKHLELTN